MAVRDQIRYYMPIRYNLALYNCLVAITNGRIVMIYPKSALCDDDIYRETRYFVTWKLKHAIIDFRLDKEYGFEQVDYTTKVQFNFVALRSLFRLAMVTLLVLTESVLDLNYVKNYGSQRPRPLIMLSKP